MLIKLEFVLLTSDSPLQTNKQKTQIAGYQKSILDTRTDFETRSIFAQKMRQILQSRQIDPNKAAQHLSILAGILS